MTLHLAPLSAATIEKVKGNSAIVGLEEGDATPAPGDKLYALEDGKKKAILEVKQVKGKKIKVSVRKGTALAGMEVTAAPKKKDKPNADAASATEGDKKDGTENSTNEDKPSRKANRGSSKNTFKNGGIATLYKDMTIGATFAYAMDSQSVTISGVTQALSGSGFGFKAFADIPIAGDLGLLARGGAEQFNVQKDLAKTEILYAVLDLLLKYQFGAGGFRPFVMGGLGLHFPLPKSSNNLSINAISSTTVFYGGAGMNFAIGGSSYLQASVEYGMFPPSNDVTTSFIAARAGMGFRF